jgi:hypothetical protein
MRMPTLRFTLRTSLVAIAILGLCAAAARQLLLEPYPLRLTPGMRLEVPARPRTVTLVAFDWEAPPPWRQGNCFDLSPLPLSRRTASNSGMRYHVANMHWENFQEITRRLGLKRVLVEFDGQCFLVVDSGIPRHWLLEEPCPSCISAPTRDALLAKHPDGFRKP